MKMRFLIVVCLCVIVACASTGGVMVFRRDLGTAGLRDAIDLGIRVTRHHQYEFETIDSVPDMRIETRWKKRRPFPDEIELGILDAESRMILTARRRGSTNFQGIYAVYFTMENRVTPDGNMWTEGTQTPAFLEYAAGIAAEYKQLLDNIAIRR